MANSIKNVFLALFIMIGLQACGGRMAHPVMQYNALDTALSCEHFKAEFNLNKKKFKALRKEEENRDMGNAAQLILGSPLLLDLTTTIDQERKALLIRNEEIQRVGVTKNCAPFGENMVLPVVKTADARTAGLFPNR